MAPTITICTRKVHSCAQRRWPNACLVQCSEIMLIQRVLTWWYVLNILGALEKYDFTCKIDWWSINLFAVHGDYEFFNCLEFRWVDWNSIIRISETLTEKVFNLRDHFQCFPCLLFPTWLESWRCVSTCDCMKHQKAFTSLPSNGLSHGGDT